MADAFAPTAEFSIAQEQPLGGVENRAAETAIRGMTNLFGNFARTGGGSAKGPQPDPLMAGFLEQMEVIEAQRASGQAMKATMNERRLIANYVSAGGTLNDELKSVVEATTGRPFDYYGQTEQQRQFEAMTSTEEFRTAFIAAQATQPGLTEEQYMGMALSSIQDQALAGDTLARNAAGEKLSWETRLQPAYNVVLDAFKGGAVAGLLEITANGGTLTPDEVLQTKLQWDLVKQEITKPPHVTDTQWQQMQGKIKSMDDMFVTMEKLASSEHAMNNLQSTLLAAAQQGNTQLTLEETVAVLAYLKDPAAILTSGASGFNPAEALTSLLGRTEAGMRVEQDARLAATVTASNPVPTDPNAVVIPDGNVVLSTLPEEYKGYAGMKGDEVVSNLKASIATIGAIDAQAINAGNGADQDLADAYQMAGAAMMGAATFLSAGKIKEIVGNPDAVNAKLDAIAGRDPEAAIEARVMLRSGLQSQLNLLEANEAEITRYHEMQWDPVKKQYFVPGHKEHASDWAQWYSGTTDENGSFYMDNNQPGQTPKGWKDLMDRRGAIDAATNGLNALALPQEEPIEQAPTPETLEGASLSALSVAQEKLGWSETDGVDKLTDFLNNNGQNIDPTETAWCAAFVNATLKEAGMDGTGLLNARSFLQWGTEVTEPAEGDVVVLSRGDSAWQGHVGFFKGFDSKGNILILGGNQGDAVTIQAYPASRLLGYRRADGKPLPVDDPSAQFAATAMANVMSINEFVPGSSAGEWQQPPAGVTGVLPPEDLQATGLGPEAPGGMTAPGESGSGTEGMGSKTDTAVGGSPSTLGEATLDQPPESPDASIKDFVQRQESMIRAESMANPPEDRETKTPTYGESKFTLEMSEARKLKQLGGNEDTPVFETIDEALEAIGRGEVDIDSPIIVFSEYSGRHEVIVPTGE